MRFGAQLINYVTTWENILSTIEVIKTGLWDSLWFSDHFLPPAPGANIENLAALEGWSLITATAVLTNRLKLGILVTGNTYRNPALLAKMAATVDQISGGRLILGIGASWYKREHEAFGWNFPSALERSDRLEEAVELIKTLFTAKGPVDYNGRYYKLNKAHFSPACTQQPHVPIMVGGNGEKRTLRTLAKFGDICNLDFNYPASPELFKHKMEVIESHCEDIGRDPAEIRKTIHIPLHLESDEKKAAGIRKARGEWILCGTASFIINRIQQYMEAGVEEIMFGGVPSKPELYERINEEILSSFNK